MKKILAVLAVIVLAGCLNQIAPDTTPTPTPQIVVVKTTNSSFLDAKITNRQTFAQLESHGSHKILINYSLKIGEESHWEIKVQPNKSMSSFGQNGIGIIVLSSYGIDAHIYSDSNEYALENNHCGSPPFLNAVISVGDNDKEDCFYGANIDSAQAPISFYFSTANYAAGKNPRVKLVFVDFVYFLDCTPTRDNGKYALKRTTVASGAFDCQGIDQGEKNLEIEISSPDNRGGNSESVGEA